MKSLGRSISQIAWVTPSLDATEPALSALLGARRWIRLPNVHFGPENCSYLGRPADFTADIALSYAGELQLELIAPVSGESIYSDFLHAHGAGLHHVCVEVDDVGAALAQAVDDGAQVVQRGTMPGGMEFGYVSAAHAGVPFVEFARITPAIRDFFAHVKQEQR